MVVYQETYDRAAYAAVHTAGPKRDFDWRLETPERAYAAGFRRIGIAPLFGLAEWRTEAIALAEHVEYLLKNCWRSQLTVSLPRLRPGGRWISSPLFVFGSGSHPGLVRASDDLSTAGNRPEHAGILGFQGCSDAYWCHHDERRKPHRAGWLYRTGYAFAPFDRQRKGHPNDLRRSKAGGQFEVEDSRSPDEVAAALRAKGLEPVWKDWDSAILSV